MSDTLTHEARIVAAARALNKRHAELCNVNEADSWMIQGDDFREDARAALAAADAALSVQAEPVAWRFAGSYWTRYESIHEALRKQVEPLYATPQPPAPVPAVPLTDKQIGDLIPFTNRQHSGVNAWGLADMVWFARAIERAHNITGGSND